MSSILMDMNNGELELVKNLVFIVAVFTGVAFYLLTFNGGAKDTKHFKLKDKDMFMSYKNLGIKEQLVLKMLQEDKESGESPCFVITDPELADNPIIYASPGFCRFTLYKKEEIENRNCRFLQGPRTDKEDVAKIREAVEKKVEASLEINNHKKDGSVFRNQFFLMPLNSSDSDGGKKVQYFLGVQHELDSSETSAATGVSAEGLNPAWRLFMWL